MKKVIFTSLDIYTSRDYDEDVERQKDINIFTESENPRFGGIEGFLASKARYTGLLPLLLSVQPLADIVGGYTCQNRKKKG